MPEALLEHGRALEVRVSGRTLRASMPYGERARDRAERFDPGSIRPMYPVSLNLQHDPLIEVASTADQTLRLHEHRGGVALEADLRGAPLELVRRGRLTGISPEFFARRERRESGVRVLEVADVPAFGLVDVGSYATPLELRAGEWLTGTIPYGRRLQCECVGPTCEYVEFEPGSLADLGADGDVLAVGGDFSRVLGSLRRGTLRLRETDAGLEVGLSDPSTPAARAVIESSAVADFFVRPLVDEVASVARDVAITLATGRPSAVRTFKHTSVRAILIKPTTTTEGHTPAKIVEPTAPAPPPDVAPAAAAAPAAGAGHPGGTDREDRAHRRRLWL